MFQQILALVIIALIIVKLVFLKKKKEIGASEFIFWFIFWILSACFVLFIKWIDRLVSLIGFSGSGIEVLLYLAVVVLFYLNFRLRLKVEKMNKDITKIVRKLALDEQTSTDKDFLTETDILKKKL